MQTNREPQWMCWHCGYSMDSSTNVTADHGPEEGDISMCLNCGKLYFRHGEQWMPATSMEVATLSDHERRLIERMQRAREASVRVDLTRKDGHA